MNHVYPKRLNVRFAHPQRHLISLYRWITIPLSVLLILGVLAGGLFYIAYKFPGKPPARVSVVGLGRAVSVSRSNTGTPIIEAVDEHDAITALGYVEGTDRGWQAVLLRQVALGRTAEWFGPATVPVDRFTRTLALGRHARAAYRRLSPQDRAFVDAFARGMQAALATDHVRRSDEFSLLSLEPEVFEGWHVLAIERLYAWLATERPTDTLIATGGTDVRSFYDGDARVRSLLHLHGFQNSLAVAVRDSGQVHLFQRQVYGDAAIPLYGEVVVKIAGRQSMIGMYLPGTPFLPAGRRADEAWSLLPLSLTRLQERSGSSVAQTFFDRITVLGSSEVLVRNRRSGGNLLFNPPPPPVVKAQPAAPSAVDTTVSDTSQADTALAGATAGGMVDSVAAAPVQPRTMPPWTLTWNGLSDASDVAAWRAIFNGNAASFVLLTGSGLRLITGGQWTVLGHPTLERQTGRSITVGNSPWAAFVASRVDSLAGNFTSVEQMINDAYSSWAAGIVPGLVQAIERVPRREPAIDEALTYLRNWDYSYDRAGIGASLFETWNVIYLRLNRMEPAGSHVYPAFTRAVATLQREQGHDMSKWRWERVRPDIRYYPVWSSYEMLPRRARPIGRTRYAPLHSPGRGHPSAIAWGPGMIDDAPPAPAAWESWLSTGSWARYSVRRMILDDRLLLGRYRRQEDLPHAEVIESETTALLQTTLIPASE